jgi:hypothetical protein
MASSLLAYHRYYFEMPLTICRGSTETIACSALEDIIAWYLSNELAAVEERLASS